MLTNSQPSAPTLRMSRPRRPKSRRRPPLSPRYLYRDHASFGFDGGMWGVSRAGP